MPSSIRATAPSTPARTAGSTAAPWSAPAISAVVLPGLLATEAGGQKRLELDAATVGEALRALPVADLVLDERGEVRSLVHVYIDGERAHDLAAPVGEKIADPDRRRDRRRLLVIPGFSTRPPPCSW